MANLPSGLNQIDFDTPPVFNAIVKSTGQPSDEWISWFDTFYQTLVSYLTSSGIFLPRLTTVQRNALQNPVNGQMIFNLTDDSAQYYKQSSTSWISF